MKGIPVLYEDDNLLCLNKPAGLPVQGGAGVGESLDSLLVKTYKDRPLLVHRLDKDTSGVIVTAKTKESAAACAALFADHKQGLKKNYMAVCSGMLDEKGIITETLFIKGRKLDAKTFYTRLNHAELLFPESETPFSASLAELELATGRMHQIRRHLSQLGHPVLGDDKYGDFTLNKKLKKHMRLKRLLLHAASIYLPPPLIKEGLLVSAPLPDHFVDFVTALKMR